jgi:hypothetical protein
MDQEQNIEIYDDITKLPLRVFIDVTVNGNLSALIISGQPDEFELILAWSSIKSQYADVIAADEHIYFTNVFKEAHLLATTYAQVNFLIDVLTRLNTTENYSDDDCKKIDYFSFELKKLLSTPSSFTRGDKNANATYLKSCLSRAKGTNGTEN